MTSVPSSTNTPTKVIDLTYLEQGKPKENLERLSNTKFTLAPLTACITREIQKKVPYYKPTQQTIQNWSYGLGFFTTFTSLAARTLGEMVICASSQNWQTNFFPVASTCFVRAIHKMDVPKVRSMIFYDVSKACVWGLIAYTAGRIFFRDARENERFAMLDKEYSAVAEILVKSFDAATDDTAVRDIRFVAEILKTNLPIIKTHLIDGARLGPEKIDLLVQKLSIAANRVLNAKKPTFKADLGPKKPEPIAQVAPMAVQPIMKEKV